MKQTAGIHIHSNLIFNSVRFVSCSFRLIGKFNTVYEYTTFSYFLWTLSGLCCYTLRFLSDLVEYIDENELDLIFFSKFVIDFIIFNFCHRKVGKCKFIRANWCYNCNFIHIFRSFSLLWVWRARYESIQRIQWELL